MEKLIKGTHHIALKCDNKEHFDKTLDFYSRILGLEILRTWGEGSESGAMVSTGNSIIELFAAGRISGDTGSIHHMALATDDVDGCIESVRKEGYKITIEPTDIVIPSEPGFPARIGFCIGPVGEVIEFFCEK